MENLIFRVRRLVAGVLLRQERRRATGPVQVLQEGVGRGARARHEIPDLSEQARRRRRADGHPGAVQEGLAGREGRDDGGPAAGEESEPGAYVIDFAGSSEEKESQLGDVAPD